MILDALLWQVERRILRRRAARAPLPALVELLRSGGAEPARVLALSIQLGLVQRARQALADTGSAASLPIALQMAWLEGDFAVFDRVVGDPACPQALAGVSPAAQNKCLSMIAQRSPAAALAIVKSMPRRPLCAPAIALRAGEVSTARNWRRDGRWRLHADYLLIDANLATSPSEKLQCLNAYLARHGLAPLRLLDPDRPPGVANLGAGAMGSGRPNRGVAPVSVVVPTHDNEPHIRAAIESLLSQTPAPAEIIVIDDGSVDGTAAIVAALAAAHPTIRLIRLGANHGAYFARNVGLAVAGCEFVAFHDADDFAHPQRLRLAMQPMLDDAQVHATTSRGLRLADDGQFGEVRVWPLTRWTPISLVVRREIALRRAGYFEPVRFGADSEYTARLRSALSERHHRLVAEPLTIFGQRAGSLTTAGAAAFGAQGRSPPRIQYQEQWTERHLAGLLGAADLHQPMPQDVARLLPDLAGKSAPAS